MSRFLGFGKVGLFRYFSDSSRVYTKFQLYKPAVNPEFVFSVIPIPPKVVSKNGYFSLQKQGAFNVEMLPWNKQTKSPDASRKKINMMLYGNELITLINDGAGVVNKVLKPNFQAETKDKFNSVEPGALSFTLVEKKNSSLHVTGEYAIKMTHVPDSTKVKVEYETTISNGDFLVMKTLILSSIPKLYVWESAFDPIVVDSTPAPMVDGWNKNE